MVQNIMPRMYCTVKNLDLNQGTISHHVLLNDKLAFSMKFSTKFLKHWFYAFI